MLKIHKVFENQNLNDWGEVKVDGISADLHFSRVSSVPYNIPWQGSQRNIGDTETAPFISFEKDEEVIISVKTDKINSDADIVVRPIDKGVKVKVEADTATFKLKEHGGYTFEVNGFHNALHIFYNPERDFLADANASGRKVIHYPAGVHNVGRVDLDSNTAVVIDAGAVVKGSFVSICKSNISICGYGVIDAGEEVRRVDTVNVIPYHYEKDLTDENNLRDIVDLGHFIKDQEFEFDVNLDDGDEKKMMCGCIRFYNCSDFKVEGVIMRDAGTFTFIPACSRDFVIDNAKTIGMWKYNSDGIDIFNCQNVVIRNCFLRNFDDCIVIKGMVGWDTQNLENILVENCVIWCDWGGALEIGAETNADYYKNITFRNCDIIHGNMAMMRIHHHNRALITNVTYEDIRAEFTKYCLPLKFIEEGKPYAGEEGKGQPYLFVAILNNSGRFGGKTKDTGDIDGVLVKDIKIYKDESVDIPLSELFTLKSQSKIKNVKIENVSVNGERIKDYSKYLVYTMDEQKDFTENIIVD